MNTKTLITALMASAALAGPAHGGSHLWRVHELYSNADGSIQFIELKECCGGNMEIGISGKWVYSVSTGNTFTFPPGYLPPGTANKHLLLATPSFAILPGAPTPDYLIPENFFNPAGDTILYWTYKDAPMSFGPGQLPVDGVHSLVCETFGPSGCASAVVEVNSPTNFDDESGSIGGPCHPADLDDSGAVDVDDLVALILAWGDNPGHPADLDDSGVVDVDDLVTLILGWGEC